MFQTFRTLLNFVEVQIERNGDVDARCRRRAGCIDDRAGAFEVKILVKVRFFSLGKPVKVSVNRFYCCSGLISIVDCCCCCVVAVLVVFVAFVLGVSPTH